MVAGFMLPLPSLAYNVNNAGLHKLGVDTPQLRRGERILE